MERTGLGNSMNLVLVVAGDRRPPHCLEAPTPRFGVSEPAESFSAWHEPLLIGLITIEQFRSRLLRRVPRMAPYRGRALANRFHNALTLKGCSQESVEPSGRDSEWVAARVVGA